MTTEAKLGKLKKLDQTIEKFQADRQSKLDFILTSEIKAEIDKINEDYQIFTNGIQKEYSAIEAEIKAEVLQSGETVKGVYQAIYVKGRVSWDTEMLGGYALAHPEIESLRRVGKASVRIKK